MVGAIWRRLRSALRGVTAPRSGPEPPPAVTGNREAAAEPRQSTGTLPPEAASAAPAPRPVSELARSLAERLTEDETLRGNLSDEAFEPLLDWALRRVDLLAERCGARAPEVAEACFESGGRALRELLRVADLAIGQRAAQAPDLALGRLQLLDTLIEPPLFGADEVTAARRRLAELLEQPASVLAGLADAELARRVVAALG